MTTKYTLSIFFLLNNDKIPLEFSLSISLRRSMSPAITFIFSNFPPHPSRSSAYFSSSFSISSLNHKEKIGLFFYIDHIFMQYKSIHTLNNEGYHLWNIQKIHLYIVQTYFAHDKSIQTPSSCFMEYTPGIYKKHWHTFQMKYYAWNSALMILVNNNFDHTSFYCLCCWHRKWSIYQSKIATWCYIDISPGIFQSCNHLYITTDIWV